MEPIDHISLKNPLLPGYRFEKNTDGLNSSFSRPLIFHGVLSFVVDRDLWLILLWVLWIVFARSVLWHPLSTLLLAHLHSPPGSYLLPE